VKLAQMTAVEQLDFVALYLKRFKGKMNPLSDVYMTILFPTAVGEPDASVLFRRPSGRYDKE